MKALPVVIVALVSFLAGGLLVTSLLPKPDTGSVDVRRVDATASYVRSGTELTLTPLIENTKKSDSGSIRLDIKVKRPGSAGVVGEGNNTLGFLKAESSQPMGIFLPIRDSGTGTYSVEMVVSEDGKELRTRTATVTISESSPKPKVEPPRLRLLDLPLTLVNLTESSALLEVAPRVRNDGGPSGTIEVTVDFLDPAGVAPRTPRAQGFGLITPIPGQSEGAAVLTLALTDKAKDYRIEVRASEQGGQATARGTVSPSVLNVTTLPPGKRTLFPVLTEGVPPALTTPAATPTPAASVFIEYAPPPTPKASPGFEAVLAVAALGIAALALRRRR